MRLALAVALAGCDDAAGTTTARDLSAAGAEDLALPPPADDLPAPVYNADAAARPLPALPLRTSGRFIVDAHGKRFKLVAVNWYGAEESDHVVAGLDRRPLAELAALIAAQGFNAVRLPWSNEMLELNPVVADASIAANPELRGKHALEVFDAVVAALAYEGLVVILDNHTSSAGWCCSLTDGNTLWYTNA